MPQGRIDPTALKLLSLYPRPTASGLQNNFFYRPTLSLTLNQYDIRIDQNFNPSNSLWGVFDVYNIEQVQPGALPGIANGQVFGAGNSHSPHWATAFSYTHVFSPTLINELHFGVDHAIDDLLPDTANQNDIAATYGITNVPQSPGFNGGLPPVTIGGLAPLGMSPYMPTRRNIHSVETMDNLTKSLGNHILKIGFQVDSIVGDISHAPLPTYNFTGQYSDIPNLSNGYTGIADLLLAPRPSSVAGGIDGLGGLGKYGGTSFSEYDEHRWYTGIYFQDDWKMTPRLTANLGLRWDHYTPYVDVHGHQANFVPNDGNGPGGTFYLPNATCNTPMSSTFVALLAKDGVALKCASGLALGTMQSLNFAPRIGLAYRVKSDFVVRAGYGITYGGLDNVGGAPNVGHNYPFYYTLALNSVNSYTPLRVSTGETATLGNAFSNIDLENPTSINGQNISLAGIQWDYKTPYIQSFNLAAQYQFGAHDSVQVAYVGTLGRHLDNLGITNTPKEVLPTGTNIYQHIPFPDFAPSSPYDTTTAVSSYNALQATFSHQLAAGLDASVNYTYSKCMTNQTAQGNGVSNRAGTQWMPGLGLAANYQLCASDAAQVVHAYGNYALPFGAGHRFATGGGQFVQALVGGWNVNYIYTYQSGQPFSIPCAVSTSANGGCYANLVAGQNIYAGPHDQTQWLNSSAFATPAVATTISQTDYASFGSRPGQVRGPGFNNLDASLFKSFPIKDQVRLEFRAEAFNATNTPQFGTPTQLDYTNRTAFSRITSLRNTPRLGQLALKLYY